ncbi:MAG: hypothetical protein ACE14P_04765 [Methanotrichaceae archaeon]
MKLLPIALSMILLSGVVLADVPDWVRPGISATYRMISGGWINGGPTENGGAEVYITNQVDEVTAEGTVGTASIYNPHTGQTQTQQITCLDGGPACLGRFWLDPKDPAGSFKDETGVTYSLLGRMPYSSMSRTWNAATMVYKNPGSGVTYTVIYDTQSGLVLAYSHEYPSEKIYLTLQSTNAEI